MNGRKSPSAWCDGATQAVAVMGRVEGEDCGGGAGKGRVMEAPFARLRLGSSAAGNGTSLKEGWEAAGVVSGEQCRGLEGWIGVEAVKKRRPRGPSAAS